MNSRISLAVAVLGVSLAHAQLPNLTSAPAQNSTTEDPLGRSTPRGAVLGFLQAAQAGRYNEAARYLRFRVPPADSGAKLARELKAVLDQGYSSNLTAISNRPEGSPEDGLPPNQERAGFINLTTSVPLLLERVEDPDAGRVWLIAEETVRRVPQLYREIGVLAVEQWLPQWLVDYEPLGVAVWKWLAGIVLFPILAGVSWLVVQLARLPGLLWRRYQGLPAPVESWRSMAIGPAVLLLAMMLHRVAIGQLGVPVLYRYYYGIVIWIGVLGVFAWLAWRLIDRATRLALERYRQDSLPIAASIVGLARRLLKITVLVAALMAILSLFGFEMKTLLAGVGIGGIAVALAAQKTIENFFGGISLLGDRVLHVGDALMMNGRVAIVEDIGLRSTRFRTLERTELSIPNGALSMMNIDNLSRRDKFFFNPVILLRLETTADQLRHVLAEFRKVLYQHPRVERETVRVRLTNFDDSGYRIEFFSYVLTRDPNEFFAIREDLLLHCLRVIEDAGSGLAYPSQTLYLARDSGIDRTRAQLAEQTIASLRAHGELPFPDFRPEDIERMRGKTPYPPEGSALRRPDPGPTI